jgi:quinol monooxygenase YgiN
MTLYIALDLTIKSELVDEAQQVFHEILVQTRAFPGCLSVDVYAKQADPAHWHVIEAWESEEHDAQYRAFRQSPEGATRMGEFTAAPSVVTKYTLARDV